MEIQAQSDDMDIIADKVLKLISAKASIQLTAAKEITLLADGSYIRINGNGIEQGTKGKWTVYANTRKMLGGKDMQPLKQNCRQAPHSLMRNFALRTV